MDGEAESQRDEVVVLKSHSLSGLKLSLTSCHTRDLPAGERLLRCVGENWYPACSRYFFYELHDAFMMSLSVSSLCYSTDEDAEA